jgi:2'-5' RNA ligase
MTHAAAENQTIRAFIAVDFDEGTRASAAGLVAKLRRPGSDGVRWVRSEALHVTLRFLGNIAPEQVGPLARSVTDEVAGIEPFRLQLGEVHLFPSQHRPRVVALRVGPLETLSELAAAVERGTRAAGFEPEDRRFHAHLTLGRVKSGPPPAVRGLGADASCDVEEVVLFRSELHREGATYTVLERMRLGGRGGSS